MMCRVQLQAAHIPCTCCSHSCRKQEGEADVLPGAGSPCSLCAPGKATLALSRYMGQAKKPIIWKQRVVVWVGMKTPDYTCSAAGLST